MTLGNDDIEAIALTGQLAAIVTIILLLISTPLAWWLTFTRSRLRSVVAALVAMPLVLPPTVLGFYLLVALGPVGIIGKITSQMGIGTLTFTFWGLVFGSVIYSLPFVVQPIHNALTLVGKRPLEVAATLGASPARRFFSVALPLARSGFFTAAVLGFAHTVGEFGLILMIGGNIPGETRVASIQVYNYVESLNYAAANNLSLFMLLFSFFVLLGMYATQYKQRQRQSLY